MASILPLTAKPSFAPDPLSEIGQWSRSPSFASPAERLQQPPPLLLHTIERHVLPRLLRLHPPTRPTAAAPAEMAALAARAAVTDPGLLNSSLGQALARGTSIDTICLEVLAPAARLLGDLWMEDDLDFVQVTIAVQRLQQALLRLTSSPRAVGGGRQRSVLIIPVPGNQHSFGVAMVARFFRRAGWTVRSDPMPTMGDLARAVRETRFDVVGFSASCDRHLEPLALALRTVRGCSCNSAVGTMVGGPLFTAHPELAVQLGADAMAADGAQAPMQAESLLRDHEDLNKAGHNSVWGRNGTTLRIVTPEERGGSGRSDINRSVRADARRARFRHDPAHHPGGC